MSWLSGLGDAVLDTGKKWAEAEIRKGDNDNVPVPIVPTDPVVLNPQPFVSPAPLSIDTSREMMLMVGSAIAVGVLVAVLTKG